MNRRLIVRWITGSGIAALCAVSAAGETSLSRVELTIDPLSAERIRITMSCVLTSPLASSDRLVHLAILLPGQQIRDVTASVDGESKPVEESDGHSAFRATLSGPIDARYSMRYEVLRNGNNRLGLLVPPAPLTGELRLVLTPGARWSPRSDASPPFSGPGAQQTRLREFPGLLFLPLVEGPGETAPFAFSLPILTDFSLLLILVVVTGYWWKLRRATAMADVR